MKVIFSIVFIALSFATTAPAQVFTTSLKLTVRNEIGNAVDSAKVTLFSSKEDYLKEVNPVSTGQTDEKGIIKFKRVVPLAYFILVRKGARDNIGGGEEIHALKKNRLNKATIIIQ